MLSNAIDSVNFRSNLAAKCLNDQFLKIASSKTPYTDRKRQIARLVWKTATANKASILHNNMTAESATN